MAFHLSRVKTPQTLTSPQMKTKTEPKVTRKQRKNNQISCETGAAQRSMFYPSSFYTATIKLGRFYIVPLFKWLNLVGDWNDFWSIFKMT